MTDEHHDHEPSLIKPIEVNTTAGWTSPEQWAKLATALGSEKFLIVVLIVLVLGMAFYMLAHDDAANMERATMAETLEKQTAGFKRCMHSVATIDDAFAAAFVVLLDPESDVTDRKKAAEKTERIVTEQTREIHRAFRREE